MQPKVFKIANVVQDNKDVQDIEDETFDNSNKDVQDIEDETFDNSNNVKDIKFKVGMLEVHEDTEILTYHQKHLVIGVENEQDSTIVNCFGIFTSEKGTKQQDKPNISTNIKLSETQPLSGEKKGQYVSQLFPQIKVDHADFIVHDEGSAFVNQPDIKNKVKEINKFTAVYGPQIVYNGKGITLEDLEQIKIIRDDLNDFENKIKEVKVDLNEEINEVKKEVKVDVKEVKVDVKDVNEIKANNEEVD